MNDFADLLQERLEQLEAGEPLDACLEGLPEAEANLLQIAASLRKLPYTQANPTAVAQQRAQLLQRVTKETTMNNNTDKVPFLTWLRSALTTMPGAAVGLAALVLIIWLSFNLFKPEAPAAETIGAPPATTVEETSPTINVAGQETEMESTMAPEATEAVAEMSQRQR